MNNEDIGAAETQVSSVLVMVCQESPEMAEHVMKAVEKFGVRPEWFRDKDKRQVFEAVTKVWREHHELDLFHVRNAFEGERFGDVFADLMDKAPSTSANIEYYLDALKQKWIYSSVYKLLTDAIHDMRPADIGIQVEDLVKRLHDLQNDLAESDNGLRQLGDYMQQSLEKKQRLHEERFVNHNWEYMDGLRWPWKEVDQIFSGLKTGLHILAALASQGKSTMAVNLSVFWNEMGIRHGFFSIDMAADQLADRYPCVVGRCSLAKLNFGGSHDDVEKFRLGFEKSVRLNNVWLSEVDDAKTMEYQCYRGVKTLGWKAIIIDYIQLVHSDDKGGVPEYTRVQHAVQAIKGIAKKLKVPIVCLAQLSRAFEQQLREKGFAPGLDAIGDSAEIARAAASVTCIYQDEEMKKYWSETPPVALAFADAHDKMWQYGLIDRMSEDPMTTEQRRKGQVSLARQLRPVWFDVKKNQQGRCGKIPFVMFPNYFLFRPGNSDGEKIDVMVGGKSKSLPVQQFEQIRDDWTYTDQDWFLEVTNAMPQRGVKLMGETYEEMRERMAAERARHPEVRHFVDGQLIEAQE